MVETTLRFLIEQVGQVEGAYPSDGKLSQKFLIKRMLGDGIDLAGIVAFHASPVWVFAALADLSGAGRQLVDEIATSLKNEGLLDRDTKFAGVDQILDGLERTSGQLAASVRYPTTEYFGAAQRMERAETSRSDHPTAQPAFARCRAAAVGGTETRGREPAPIGVRAFVADCVIDSSHDAVRPAEALPVSANGDAANWTILRPRDSGSLPEHDKGDP
jgi:hypothetical protein